MTPSRAHQVKSKNIKLTFKNYIKEIAITTKTLLGSKTTHKEFYVYLRS